MIDLILKLYFISYSKYASSLDDSDLFECCHHAVYCCHSNGRISFDCFVIDLFAAFPFSIQDNI